MVSSELNRREFIRLTAAGVATACLPKLALTLEPVMKKAIPETGEMLPIVCLDTAPRNAANYV